MDLLQKLANDIYDWAIVTFKDQTAHGVANHLQKEAIELSNAILINQLYPDVYDYKEELADCLMLVLELSRLLKIPVDVLLEDTQKKLEKNKLRKWKTPDKDGIIEHVKEN